METSTRIISRRHNVISRGDLRRKAIMGLYTFLNVRGYGFRFEYVKSENFLLTFLSFSLKRESKLKRLDSPVSSTPCQARGRLRQAYQVRNDTMSKFIRLRRRPRPWTWRNALMRDIQFQRSIYHASADFAHRRVAHRSLGACAPKRFSAQGRRGVWFCGT